MRLMLGILGAILVLAAPTIVTAQEDGKYSSSVKGYWIFFHLHITSIHTFKRACKSIVLFIIISVEISYIKHIDRVKQIE